MSIFFDLSSLLLSFLVVFFSLLLLFVVRLYQNYKTPTKSTKWKTVNSPTVVNEEAFINFRDEIFSRTSKQPVNATYKQSAAIVSDIVASGTFLNVADLIRANATKLFWAHRLCAAGIEGGLAVRLTVQYNLFGGTIANLGSDKQRKWLEEVFSKGELGCFLLTESGAGVLSGLIVETTCTWNGSTFDLHSPEPLKSSRKCWISQGLTATWGAVIARLILQNGEDKGPHAFIVPMNAAGVIREDMDRKTDFNSLDNAYVHFDHVQLPKEYLLQGVSFINDQNEYELVNPKQRYSFVTVAQRLLSGRICIAGASLSHVKLALTKVENYGSERLIPIGPGKVTPLSSLPILRDLIETQKLKLSVFEQFVILLENEFMKIDEINDKLVDKIACAKIEAIAFAITSLIQLKDGVGSLSLFENGPFGSKNDILYVFRFAEGDSGILQQKMARDAVKRLANPVNLLKEIAKIPAHILRNSDNLGIYRASLSYLLVKLAFTMKGVPKDKLTSVWLENHKLITSIAHKKALLTIYDCVKHNLKGSKELECYRQYVITQ